MVLVGAVLILNIEYSKFCKISHTLSLVFGQKFAFMQLLSGMANKKGKKAHSVIIRSNKKFSKALECLNIWATRELTDFFFVFCFTFSEWSSLFSYPYFTFINALSTQGFNP